MTKIPGTLFVQHPSPCGMHHRKTVGLPRIRDRPIAVAGRRCHTAGKETSFWKDLDIRMESNLMAVFASREKPVLWRKVPEISSSPLRPDTLSSTSKGCG